MPRLALGAGVLSKGVKWLGHKVNHSGPSSAEVRNEWGYVSTPPICLYGMDRKNLLFRCVHKIAKSNCLFCHVCLSMYLHGTTPLPLDWIWIFFQNLSRKFKFLARIMGTQYEAICTSMIMWYLAGFFLKWEMFQTQVVQKIKTYTLCSRTFFF
jgi:hypothetical protein